MTTSSTSRPVTAAASLRALLTGLIDYAGLFPPAALDMPTAVANYARYLAGEHRFALGRFIIPVARLDEFLAAQNALNLAEPWRISAIVANPAELALIRAFNAAHPQRALIDALEIKAASIEDVRRMRPLVPDAVIPYFEIAADSRPEMFQAIKAENARAKIRTGGVVETAFPAAEAIAQFIIHCADARLAFKATAGLHHPVRCVKPLTYEPDAPTGKMHGFLNLFIAACAYGGLGEQTNRTYREQVKKAIVAFLLNEVPANFVFTDEKAVVRGAYSEVHEGVVHNGNYEISLFTDVIHHVREHFAIAFGSCSFEEPIEDLRSLQLL